MTASPSSDKATREGDLVTAGRVHVMHLGANGSRSPVVRAL